MRKTLLLLIGLGWLLGAAPAGAQYPDEEAYRTSVQIRITLPDDAEPLVAVSPGAQRISLELPRGSAFPLDFSESSGGLIRDGKVMPLDDGRVRLDLDLAMGVLDRIEYEPRALVLRFQSRFDVRNRVSTTEDQYRLGPDDQISIVVHGHSDLNAELTITDEGYITAPLVGDVEAVGMTPRELASRLAEMLGRDYLVDPQVDVEIEEFRSQWVMAAGEIRIPGRVALRGGTRLKEVLSEAGGFTENAGELITITRRTDDETDSYTTLEFARGAFEAGTSNPVLVDGDIISVSEAKYCYLQGEVGAPGRVRIERGMTLLKAIAQSGGLTDWANRKKVLILQGDGTKPKVINLKDIQSGKLVDPVLEGGELIVVKRRFF